MRPKNNIARERFNTVLRRVAPCNARTLAEQLDVSVSSIHRIANNHPDVIKQGITKSTQYALRRPLRGNNQAIPIYQIDAQGKGHQLSQLDLIYPQGSLLSLANIGWPNDKQHTGWWDGLPYPIYDMRPQGFLGRNFAHHIADDFGVSTNPERWSDDDILHVLTLRGTDTSGNLIIGDIAYQRWLTSQATLTTLSDAEIYTTYPELALASSNNYAAGSSAGGEFPKFTACRTLENATTPHVIVKFSGADQSTAVQRWSDLLICEHLALETLAKHTAMPSAKSRIIQAQGRTFLEVERFDRVGLHGRLPVISLSAIANALIGEQSSWPELTQQLIKLKLADERLLKAVSIIWCYGKLIANNDMHLGNLSFTFDHASQSNLTLCPTYDMLPMLYAPLAGGEVAERNYTVAKPLPQEQHNWLTAAHAAQQFWETASQDARISEGFRAICQRNQMLLTHTIHQLT